VTEDDSHPVLEGTDAESNTSHVSWTSLRYQPAFPWVPEIVGVTVGGELSIFTSDDVYVALLPA
jgi:hypothetical protein